MEDAMQHLSRRTFLQTAATAIAAGTTREAARSARPRERSRAADLSGEVGVTTSSFAGHLATKPGRGRFTLLELPAIMRNELGMRVIDLNTAALASHSPAYLDGVRAAAEKAGCVLTNLKLNQRGLDMNSADRTVRAKALRVYKQSIDDAARLGIRWARPLPLKPKPDIGRHVAAYRELADYAAGKNVRMLVENYGWMQAEADSVVKLIKAVDRNLAASPDIGNWNSDALRYAGLAETFPLAVTCDFKARALGPKGEHRLYDLKRCFQIGWNAGFRGPWCLEHANRDRKKLFAELVLLRDMLRGWMKRAKND